MSTTNLEIARDYLAAIEHGEELARFYDPGVTYREHPNRVAPSGATRDLAALQAARARGKQVVEGERYVVRGAVALGERVALQVEWSARLKIALGTLPAGETLRASSAMFLRFHAGRIVEQENYDCFAPF